MRKLLTSFLTFTFIFSFVGIGVIAQDKGNKIGTIVSLRGKVVRINKVLQRKEFLTVGSIIFENDIVGSGKKSFVKILMKDDTLFQLGPKSKFAFEKFNYQSKKKRKAVYNLIIGKLRSLFTNKAEDGDDLELNTPNAAMAVRGTEILSDVYSKEGRYRTDIALLSGKLDIKTQSKEVVNLKPGFILETGDYLKNKTAKTNAYILKRIPSKWYTQLQNPHQRNGKVFLHDARKSHYKMLKKRRKGTKL
ncbi:MAG: FecR family protein [Bacteriovoracaceae bacterium]